MPDFPNHFYIGQGDYGPKIGIGGGTDFVTALDDAADMLIGIEQLTGENGRIVEVDLDRRTSRDVTATCIALIRNRSKEAAE